MTRRSTAHGPRPTAHGPRRKVFDGSGLRAEVARLRTESSGDIPPFGSSGLTVTLLGQGLVDELRVLVHPVLVGDGRGGAAET